MIEAAERFGDDQQFRFGETEHVAEFVFAEDRHQGIDDGTHPEGSERDYGELPPIGKLHRDDATSADAKALQSGGRARNDIAEIAVREAPPFGAIRTVGPEREFSSPDGESPPQKF